MPVTTRIITASTVAIALTLAPAVIGDLTPLSPDTAFANNGKGNGNGGGNGNGNRGNGNGGGNKDRGNDDRSASRIDRSSDDDRPVRTALRPDEKGRWNASNANQRALDAHIRNQNFNGTIGILSQYQLAAKAANGEDLTRAERAALETFVDTDPVDVPDTSVERFLNRNSADNGYTFAVSGGVVTCVAGCENLSDNELKALETRAQNAADGFVDRKQQAALQADLDQFLEDSEDRITTNSNKRLTAERNEDLLDELADDLDVLRREVSSDFRSAGQQIRSDMREAGSDISKAFRNIFGN